MSTIRQPTKRLNDLRPLSALEWVAGIAVVLTGIYFLLTNAAVVPKDFSSIWRGIHTFASGTSPYVRHPNTSDFVFTPSAALLLWPEAASRTLSGHLWGLADFLMLGWLALGAWRATHHESLPAPRWWAWAMLAAAFFLCGRMGRGNYDIATASLVLASLILVSGRFRHRLGRFGHAGWGGVALGLAIALKITALPMLLIFVLLGEWTATALAVAVPVVLNGIAILRIHQMTSWARWTLPYLRTRVAPVRPTDVSFQALLSHSAASRGTLWAAIGVVLIAALVWMTKLWHDHPPVVSKLILTAGLLSVVLSLCTPGSFDYYWVYALPALVVAGRDKLSAVLAAVALVGIAVPEAAVNHILKLPGLRLVADTRSLLAFLLLAASLAVALVRQPGDAAQPAGSTAPTAPDPRTA